MRRKWHSDAPVVFPVIKEVFPLGEARKWLFEEYTRMETGEMIHLITTKSHMKNSLTPANGAWNSHQLTSWIDE